MTHSSHSKYRPDIDGLRAIAVILVVFYHAFPDVVTGGFIGVDIFFVISGFLISTIVIENTEAGTFSFLDFYARRIKRIFPALIVVLVACSAVGWWVLLPRGYQQFGNQLLGGATFVANLVLWYESGYFDVSSDLKPLLHLWSLGVEEQFYLIWPLLLWASIRAGFATRVLTWIILALSFGLNLALVKDHPVADFYSPASRFWELMLGCALAHAAMSRQRGCTTEGMLRSIPDDPAAPAQELRDWRLAANVKSLAGLVLVASGAFGLHKGIPFPGTFALLPTVGAYLLISGGSSAFFNQKILSHPALVFVGLISYPLYLWHWPLLSFARIYQTETPSVLTRLAIVLLSVSLAWATYRFVEKPLRFGRKGFRTVLLLASTMTVVAIAGLAMILSNGFPSRLNENARRYASYPTDERVGGRVNTCWLSLDHAADAYADECVDKESSPRRPLLMVWGDSHAARLFIGLREIAGHDMRMAQYTRSSCPPFILHQVLYQQRCIDANRFILRRISELKPDVVVLFGYWQLDAMPGASAVAIADGLNATIDGLRELGVARIVVMGPAPRWNISLPDNLVRMQLSHPGEQVPGSTAHGLDQLTGKLDADLRARIVPKPGVLYFSVYGALCSERGCLTRIGDDLDALTSMDYGHLTKPGAVYVAHQLQMQSHNFWMPAIARRTPSDKIFATPN